MPHNRPGLTFRRVRSSSRPLLLLLALGDELMDLRLPDDSDSQWLSQGGRDMAAAHLLPRAEAALRQELQRLAHAELILKRLARALTARGLVGDQSRG